jgi:glucose-fructose oxidoreductase
VRIIRALYRSAETGRPVELPAFEKHDRPSLEQEIRRPPIDKPQVIHAAPPSGRS